MILCHLCESLSEPLCTCYTFNNVDKVHSYQAEFFVSHVLNNFLY